MGDRVVIQRIRIAGTGFFGLLDVSFSDGLNCIIGARGTGKTSILELIRFATGRDDDTPEIAARVNALLREVLGHGGTVDVDVTTQLGERLTIHRSLEGLPTATNRDTATNAKVTWPLFPPDEL